MMIDTETSTVSRALLMQQIRKITTIAKTIQKM